MADKKIKVNESEEIIRASSSLSINKAYDGIIALADRKVFPSMEEAETFAAKLFILSQKKPEIRQCTSTSIIRTMMFCHTAKLDPLSHPPEVYLMPFGSELSFIVEYKTKLQEIYAGGQVKYIDLKIVFSEDHFDLVVVDGESILSFSPDYNLPRNNFENYKGVLMICTLKDGTKIYDFCTQAQINDMRNSSKAYHAKKKDSPWHTRFIDRMIKRSALTYFTPLLPGQTKRFRTLHNLEMREEGDTLKFNTTTADFEDLEDATMPEIQDAEIIDDVDEALKILNPKEEQDGKDP